MVAFYFFLHEQSQNKLSSEDADRLDVKNSLIFLQSGYGYKNKWFRPIKY